MILCLSKVIPLLLQLVNQIQGVRGLAQTSSDGIPVDEAKRQSKRPKTRRTWRPSQSLRSDLTGIRQRTRPCWSDHENTANVFFGHLSFCFAESLKVLCLWCPAHTHPYNLQSLVCECGSEIVYLCLWDCSGRTADLQMCVLLFFISLKSNNSRNWLFDESSSALND